MSDNKAQAQAAKNRGNAAFAAKNFEEAVKAFSEAIELDPTDHVFFSNRSGAYASLNKWDEALKDADACVALQKSFAKGYSRRGVALFNLGQLEEAKKAYEDGLAVDPSNQALKDGLADVEARMAASSNPFAKLFGPEALTKLIADPSTRGFLADPGFMQKFQMVQKNPQLLNSMLQSDPRFQQVLGVLLGINFSAGAGAGAGADDAAPMQDEEPAAAPPKPAEPARPKAPEPAPAPAPTEEEPLDEEEKARREKRRQAEAEKEEGNKLYKARKFEEALAAYNRAVELDPSNASYLSNIAAVHYERKEYDQCIEVCVKADQVAVENMAPFQLRGRIWARVGNAYAAQKKYAEAIEAYEKSLLENHDDKVRDSLKKAQAEKRKLDELNYLSKDKALEHKNKGNDLFKEGKFVEAISEYTEAIKRDPTVAVVYSNRAMCFSKLMDWGRALEDAEKCKALDPTYVKNYVRLARVQHFLKQYHKAVDTYKAGLELDPKNAELMDGLRHTQQQIAVEHMTGKVDPRRAEEAMKDPEIQAILRDPVIAQVLRDLSSNPKAAQEALRDADISRKIDKLVAAGILARGGPGAGDE